MGGGTGPGARGLAAAAAAVLKPTDVQVSDNRHTGGGGQRSDGLKMGGTGSGARGLAAAAAAAAVLKPTDVQVSELMGGSWVEGKRLL
jgi:hypothetical protein